MDENVFSVHEKEGRREGGGRERGERERERERESITLQVMQLNQLTSLSIFSLLTEFMGSEGRADL